MSVLIAGLLLAAAPAAFAQIGPLLATAPAALADVYPAPGNLGTDISDFRAESGVQHRSGTRSATKLIKWDGTSQSLRCTYALLVGGSTRDC